MRAAHSGSRHSFTGRIERVGPLYCVAVPASISTAIGVRRGIPVVARVARGAPFRATLVPSGGGRHRLFVNGETRRAARAKLNGRIHIEVRVDWEPREVALPDDLTRALREEGVLASWESMPPGKREHILKWIDAAVHEPTREKRIARAVEEALVRREKQVDRGPAVNDGATRSSRRWSEGE